ncbi:unnamed protein product, partial [marine sediment metagenome]
SLAEKEQSLIQITVQLEEMKSELSAFKLPEIGPVERFQREERVICPMCGETAIKEIDDKTKVQYYSGTKAIYAKKKICKKCGYEF